MGDDGQTAQSALDAVQRSPREALAIAERLLSSTAADGATAERSTALRAAGLALRELQDLPAALRQLRRAVRTGERAGSPRTAALARMSLGYVLAGSGRNVAALNAVSAALRELTGLDAGRARMQRGVVLHYSGRYEEAARDYAAAIEIAQQEGDLLLEARARNNRGALQTHRSTPRGAAELVRAEAIFRQLGLDVAAADTRWNLGNGAARRGEVATALRVFAEVGEEYRRLEVPRPELQVNRLEVLLSVPLVDEAVATAGAVVAELERRKLDSALAEALLGQARAALLAGDPGAASAVAGRAQRLFTRQGRPVWALIARTEQLHAEFRRGTRTTKILTTMVRAATHLDAAGWPGPALAVRLEAAQVARDVGKAVQARHLLGKVATARRGGSASRRAQGWYATALLHRIDAADTEAAAALRHGLTIVDQHRASLGATELRASSGVHGRELALEGLRIAVGRGRPAAVLTWAERWRATTMRMTPVAPPRDPALAETLAELRSLSSAMEDTILAGRPAPPAQRRRQAKLEQHVRELTRRAEGDGVVARPPGVGQLAAALGDAVLVELLAPEGRLLAVVVRDGRATLHHLGPLEEALHQVRLLGFALRRVVSRGDSEPGRLALTHAAAALDDRLLTPLRNRLADRPLVIVPPGELQAVPWSALPTCAGRAVTAAPSAASWLRATGRPLAADTAMLAAGPRLPEAEQEVAALAAATPRAVTLTGPRATVRAVLEAMSAVRLAHLAAHGRFRADNPLLSTIELADGPLTAYELELLPAPPSRVVLSACESGRSAVRPGSELMGLAAVLLGAGTSSLIVSLVRVPADRTTELMLVLHERMRAGQGPAEALAGAQQAVATTGDGLAQATAAAFTCLGAG